MDFIRKHLLPSIGIAIGGIWSIYGIMSEAWQLWTAGLTGPEWTAVGALIFMASVVTLLMRFERRMQVGSVSIAPPVAGTPPPQSGSAVLRKVFQNEELRITDLLPAGELIIRGKTFIDCIFYGPAVVTLVGNIHIDGLGIEASDPESALIEVAPDRRVIGVVGFESCRLERCRFKQIGIMGTAQLLAQVRKAFGGT